MFPYTPWLCWIIPIIGAIVTPLIGAIRRRFSSYVAVLSIGLSAFFSFLMIPDILAGQIGPLAIPWHYPELGVLIDPLSVLMASVISCIGFLVTVFSVAYMQEEPSLARFWVLIQLFIGGYLVIVLADNLLFMFIGWETVGICCTGLAAFWHKDPNKAHMGLKTFMVLRVADVLLLASILLIYTYSDPQTLNITELAENNNLMGELARSSMLFITAFMFFGGAIGKAAQFPLQEWLPDALAASPSSFNALTECLAGPFIMARILPIFRQATQSPIEYSGMINFFLVMALVGALTAVISALIAVTQDNIFKVLSYSISSMIGYMMVAFGLAGLMADVSWGYLAGTFLLTVDAFISALLFLSAAYISYAVGSDNMHHMGGFKSRIAHRSMEVGALALAGIPPLSGFWCTNWIQTVALDFAAEAGNFTYMMLGYLIFALLILGAGITAFYGLRMMGLIFRKENYKSDRKVIKKPPSLMRISLAATLVITAFIDFLALLLIWPFNIFLLPMPFLEQLTFNNIIKVLEYLIPQISTVLTCVAVALGGYPAYKIYITRKADAETLMEKHHFLKTIRGLLRNRFYIDTLYYKVASSTQSLARITYKYVETEGMTKPQIMGLTKIFDTAYRGMALLSQLAYPRLELGGLEAFNRLIAKTVFSLSEKFRKIQSGVLSYNLLAVFVGIVLLVILLLLFGGGFRGLL